MGREKGRVVSRASRVLATTALLLGLDSPGAPQEASESPGRHKSHSSPRESVSTASACNLNPPSSNPRAASQSPRFHWGKFLLSQQVALEGLEASPCRALSLPPRKLALLRVPLPAH